MFESFKAVCYFPLIVFAVGWGVSQVAYALFKKELQIDNNCDCKLMESVQRNMSNILLAGMGCVVMILLGINLGATIRWLLIGTGLLFTMFMVAKLGATIEFSLKKIASDKRDTIKLVVMPHAIGLACDLISGAWMIYVFYIAGLW